MVWEALINPKMYNYGIYKKRRFTVIKWRVSF